MHQKTTFKFLILFLFIALSSTTISWGQATTAIEKVNQLIKRKIKQKKIAGAVVLIAQEDEVVHFSADGYQDIKDQKKMETNSIFRIYSMTKPICSVALMILKDRGLVELDDPIEKYLPELSKLKVYHKGKKVKPKKAITVRDLMRHTAGFTYGFFSKTKVDKLYNKNHPLFVSNNKAFLKRVASLPLLNQPGEKYHYSIATDVLGVLIERVSGQSLEEFCEKEIFKPLGMKDTGFFVPKSKVNRFCSSYKSNLRLKESYKKSSFIGPNPYRIASGGGGLVSTAEDYLQFGQMLLNKGSWKAAKILEEASVIEMTKNQLLEGDRIHEGAGFGLGVSVQLDEWGNYGHIGDYGWDGAASTHFLISPKEKTIIIILSQIQPYSNQLILEAKPIIYEALN